MIIKRKEHVFKLFKSIEKIFDCNDLYNYILNEYLEEKYDYITQEDIQSVKKENGIKDDKEAFMQCFYDLLGLTDEDDNQLLYLEENNHLSDFYSLSPSLIEDNPYHRFLSSLDLKTSSYKSIELKKNFFNPYEGFLFDEVKNNSLHEVNFLGFFKRKVEYFELVKNGIVWMSDTPYEINTMREIINKAKNNVLTFGLGLGYFPFMASIKDEVKKVTVVENDMEIIEFFKKNLLPHFPNKEKIEIVYADAFSYIEKNDLLKYSIIFVDTYHFTEDILNYFRFLKLLKTYRDKRFFWIENSLLSMLRRYVFICLSSCFEKIDFSMYSKEEMMIIKTINSKLKDHVIENKNDIHHLFEDDFIRGIFEDE